MRTYKEDQNLSGMQPLLFRVIPSPFYSFSIYAAIFRNVTCPYDGGHTCYSGNLDSSVGIVTRRRAGPSGVRVLAGARDFYARSQNCENDYWLCHVSVRPPAWNNSASMK